MGGLFSGDWLQGRLFAAELHKIILKIVFIVVMQEKSGTRLVTGVKHAPRFVVTMIKILKLVKKGPNQRQKISHVRVWVY